MLLLIEKLRQEESSELESMIQVNHGLNQANESLRQQVKLLKTMVLQSEDSSKEPIQVPKAKDNMPYQLFNGKRPLENNDGGDIEPVKKPNNGPRLKINKAIPPMFSHVETLYSGDPVGVFHIFGVQTSSSVVKFALSNDIKNCIPVGKRIPLTCQQIDIDMPAFRTWSKTRMSEKLNLGIKKCFLIDQDFVQWFKAYHWEMGSKIEAVMSSK